MHHAKKRGNKVIPLAILSRILAQSCVTPLPDLCRDRVGTGYAASPRCHHSATIYFNGVLLDYVEQVIHLGHILTSNLDDKQDIIRVIKDMNRKANSLLCTFKSANLFVKSFLIKSYCLSVVLYGVCQHLL